MCPGATFKIICAHIKAMRSQVSAELLIVVAALTALAIYIFGKIRTSTTKVAGKMETKTNDLMGKIDELSSDNP